MISYATRNCRWGRRSAATQIPRQGTLKFFSVSRGLYVTISVRRRPVPLQHRTNPSGCKSHGRDMFSFFRNIWCNKVLNKSDFAEQVKTSLTTQCSLHILPRIWSVCPVSRIDLDHTDFSVLFLVPRITQNHEYVLIQLSESVWIILPVFWWRPPTQMSESESHFFLRWTSKYWIRLV